MNRRLLVVISLVLLFAAKVSGEHQQAIDMLKTRLDVVKSSIVAEEQKQYLATRPPIYTYDSTFSAVRRHIAGADAVIREAEKREREMASLRQQGNQLQIRYNRAKRDYAVEYKQERIRRTNQGLRDAAKGRRSRTGRTDSSRLRSMASAIRGMEIQGMEIQNKISSHARQKNAMLQQEYDLRYKERVAHDLAIKGRDMRINSRYNAALAADSSLLFIAQYIRSEASADGLTKSIESNRGAIALLVKAGQADKAEGLKKKIEEAQKRLTTVREKQQTLMDNYFKPLKKLP